MHSILIFSNNILATNWRHGVLSEFIKRWNWSIEERFERLFGTKIRVAHYYLAGGKIDNFHYFLYSFHFLYLPLSLFLYLSSYFQFEFYFSEQLVYDFRCLILIVTHFITSHFTLFDIIHSNIRMRMRHWEQLCPVPLLQVCVCVLSRPLWTYTYPMAMFSVYNLGMKMNENISVNYMDDKFDDWWVE